MILKLTFLTLRAGTGGRVSGFQWTFWNGYFIDSLPLTTLTSITKTNQQGFTVSIQDLGVGTGGQYPVNNGNQYYTIDWSGCFRAPADGTYIFSINSDDASYLWINTDVGKPVTAVSSSALCKVPGIHGMIENTCSINLKQGLCYPFKIIFGQAYGGVNIILRYQLPGSSTWTYDGSGVFFHSIGRYIDVASG